MQGKQPIPIPLPRDRVKIQRGEIKIKQTRLVIRSSCFFLSFEDTQEEPTEGQVQVSFIFEGLAVAIYT